MYRNKINKGFTVTEILVSTLISSIVLVGFYQLSFGAINFFTSTKNESDNLETKTPSMELIARYFERRGVGVVTNSSSTDQNEGLPQTDKYISTGNVNGATESQPIIFYANLSGFGFVKNIAATQNLISCRLNDSEGKAIVSSVETSCYYVLRDNKIIPANLNSNNNLDSSNKPLFDSVNFASFSPPSSYTSSECVENAFVSSAILDENTNNGNSNISLNGTIVDRDSTNITSTIIQGQPNTTIFNLQNGDIIFRSPHRIKLYVKNNALDKNKKWLYVSMTPIASRCASAGKIIPIAPAESIKATQLLGDAVEISVTFRSREYKGKEKTFTAKRVFGG